MIKENEESRTLKKITTRESWKKVSCKRASIGKVIEALLVSLSVDC